VRRECVQQRPLARLRIAIPDFDPVVYRRRQYASAVEVGMQHGDAVVVARVERGAFGHFRQQEMSQAETRDLRSLAARQASTGLA